ncbi:MAG: MBL fold metallo-hydrolase [Hyphomicrobiales bacterium]|nr:MBL fold metallo-hydrolase [Hyphomicrobiales bacterium]
MTIHKTGNIQPEIFRVTLGEFEISTLLDGIVQRDGPYPIFGSNKKESEVHELLRKNYLPETKFEHGFTPLIINTGKDLILFDTGNGKLNDNHGKLLNLIEKSGYNQQDITKIVISHCHPDHIGGLALINDGYFNNATIIIGETEYDSWKTGKNIPKQRKPNRELFEKICIPLSERMSFIKPDQEVVTGITAVNGFGHSPGHMCFNIESENKRIFYAADITNHYVVSMQVPDWHVMFDDDKDLAVESRKRILSMLAKEKVPMIGFHMPFPSIGYVEEKGTSSFNWLPISYQLSF